MQQGCIDQGERVSDTSGEEVAVQKQQLIDGRSYADAVAKVKERKLRVIMWDSTVGRKLDKIINKTVCLSGEQFEDVTER